MEKLNNKQEKEKIDDLSESVFRYSKEETQSDIVSRKHITPGLDAINIQEDLSFSSLDEISAVEMNDIRDASQMILLRE
jgi:hypothetical protein